MFQVPHIVTSLQRSVQAVLLGRTVLPDWLSHGVKDSARTDRIAISGLPLAPASSASKPAPAASIASDGQYVYIHQPAVGLCKVGSGYGGTIKVSGSYFRGYAHVFRGDA